MEPKRLGYIFSGQHWLKEFWIGCRRQLLDDSCHPHAVAAARFFSVYQAAACSFVAKPRDDTRLPLIMTRA
jgi:hypothetical protein